MTKKYNAATVAKANATPLKMPLFKLSGNESDEPDAATPSAGAPPAAAERSTVAEPTALVTTVGVIDVALTRAARLLLPAAMSAAEVTAANREARVDGGVPVRIVPFANAAAPAAARNAAYVNPAVASTTPAPFDAALPAAVITPDGSAA